MSDEYQYYDRSSDLLLDIDYVYNNQYFEKRRIQKLLNDFEIKWCKLVIDILKSYGKEGEDGYYISEEINDDRIKGLLEHYAKEHKVECVRAIDMEEREWGSSATRYSLGDKYSERESLYETGLDLYKSDLRKLKDFFYIKSGLSNHYKALAWAKTGSSRLGIDAQGPEEQHLLQSVAEHLYSHSSKRRRRHGGSRRKSIRRKKANIIGSRSTRRKTRRSRRKYSRKSDRRKPNRRRYSRRSKRKTLQGGMQGKAVGPKAAEDMNIWISPRLI
jgi:hypothetical protein